MSELMRFMRFIEEQNPTRALEREDDVTLQPVLREAGISEAKLHRDLMQQATL